MNKCANEIVARRRGFAAGELEALLAEPPGEEISAATKQRINAARPGLALLPYYYYYHLLILNITYIVLIQTKYLELDLRLTKSDTDK